MSASKVIAPFAQRRLKYSATINDQALGEATDPDFQLQYIDIGNVDSSGVIHEVVTYRFEDAPSRARRLVRDGDVIVSTVRTYLQAIAPILDPPVDLVVSTGFAVVRPRPDLLDPRFCKYLLRESRFLYEVESRSVGVSYPAINASDLGDIRVALPPREDQQRIADYLDRETAEMDALIAEKGRMLALLEEKRASLITHAITRGLDLNVPLKPSGLEWLDQIPAHWNVMQLKRTWSSSEYGISESIRDEGGIRILRMSCITKDGLVDLNNAGQVEEVAESLLLHRGDLLFNRTNSLDQIAKVGWLPDEPENPTSFASYLVRIRANERVRQDYLVALLNSRDFLLFARCNAIPAIGQANLSPSRYGDIHIPLPPLDEQATIVSHLSTRIARSKKLEDDLQASIDLLKERRSALITAAVTGQIPIAGMTA
ncbi:MAG: restriction endonuclease subunit S [Planctomycetota bacterium]